MTRLAIPILLAMLLGCGSWNGVDADLVPDPVEEPAQEPTDEDEDGPPVDDLVEDAGSNDVAPPPAEPEEEPVEGPVEDEEPDEDPTEDEEPVEDPDEDDDPVPDPVGSELIDSDGDGLSDEEEAALGLDPADDDTDHDGVLDGAELTLSLDPLDDDTDDDGWLDGGEIAYGTHPLQWDTDGDGLSDALEMGLTVPQGVDTDLSIVAFDAEPSTTTDPRLADTDQGGADDGVEDANLNGAVDFGERNGADPVDDFFLDVDGDGSASAVTGGDDCDDDDPSVFPGAAEACNGFDDDCDGVIDPDGVCAGCDRLEDGGSIYLFCGTTTLAYADARDDCEARGYQLTIIEDQAENDFLSVESRFRSGYYWHIGLADLDEDGAMLWEDGSELTFTNWAPGRPAAPSAANNECVHLGCGAGSTWWDWSCTTPLHWICEL